jgi:hypothetical protein
MSKTIANPDVHLALRRMEMQQQLHRALDLLDGDEVFPDTDPVADDERQVAALSDADLLLKTYELVEYVPDQLASRFYNCLAECFARFTPELEWAEWERKRFEEYGEGSD